MGTIEGPAVILKRANAALDKERIEIYSDYDEHSYLAIDIAVFRTGASLQGQSSTGA